MVYKILSIVFLIGVLSVLFITIYNVIKKRKLVSKKNITMLLPAFFILYLMYVTASIYGKSTSGNKLDVFFYFSLIKDTLDAFAFKANSSLARPLFDSSLIWKFDFILVLLLCSLTTVLTVLVIATNKSKNNHKINKILKQNGDIVIGYSKSALKYLENNKNAFIMDRKIDYKTYSDLVNKNILIKRGKVTSPKFINKIAQGERHLILFKDSEYSYSEVVEIYKEIIKAKNLNKDLNNAIYLHIEADCDEIRALTDQFNKNDEHMVKSFVTCFNRYELIAREFIKDYPMSRYIPRDFYTSNFALQSDKQINAMFIGFGKVNLALFKLMAMEFQFAKEKNGRFVASPINYMVYDNQDRCLNNDAFSIIDFEINSNYKNSDLPKPEKICNLAHQKKDVYSPKIKKELLKMINDNSYTYIVVSLASDLENLGYANNLINFLGDLPNYKVFVRIKGDTLYKNQQEDSRLVYFGKEGMEFMHSAIVNEDIIKIAQITNGKYNSLSPLPKDQLYGWEAQLPIKQYASIYRTLNLPFALNLIGFDIAKKDNIKKGYVEVTEEEYFKTYNHTNNESLKYEDYFKLSVANMLAFIEHSRWNAHYLLSGYKVMNFKEFAPKDGSGRKNHQSHGNFKKHACLTTYYEGLDKLIKKMYLMDKYGEDYESKKVSKTDIKSKEFMDDAMIYYYDFLFMDDLYKNLANAPIKIIKKEPKKEEVKEKK